MNLFKRIFGLKGSYKWAMNILQDGYLVKRKEGKRLFKDNIAGILKIKTDKKKLSNDELFQIGKLYVLNNNICEYYKPSKEDKLSTDWEKVK
ncbi:MAG: hypothetical protein ACTSP4_00875 [Candidatus Hodarchaeales archaeon]